MGGAASTSSNRLLLSFDINKTLIIADPVSGIGVSEMVNSLLSECTWGKLTNKENPSPETWELVHDKPAAICPEEGLITYHHLIEEILGMKGKVSKHN